MNPIIMKKARIMLTAIAILSIVGGSFAFKMRSTFQIFKWNGSNCCPLIQMAVYDIAGGLPYQRIYTTANLTTTCVSNSYCTTTLNLIIE